MLPNVVRAAQASLALIAACVAINLLAYYTTLEAAHAERSRLWAWYGTDGGHKRGVFDALVRNATPVALCGGITRRSRFAVVTMISAEGSGAASLCLYANSAAKLGASLRRFVHLDMIALVFDSGNATFTRQHAEELETQGGWQVCKLPPLHTRPPPAINRYHTAKMFSKLHVWSLVEYEGILYVDADVLCLRSPAEIFTDVMPAMREEGTTLAMVRHGTEANTFNAGVMAVLPRAGAAVSMLEREPHTTYDYSLAEQGFLNVLCAGQIHRLPHRYNTWAEGHNSAALASSGPSPAVFLHFIVKPWVPWSELEAHRAVGLKEFWNQFPPPERCRSG